MLMTQVSVKLSLLVSVKLIGDGVPLSVYATYILSVPYAVGHLIVSSK